MRLGIKAKAYFRSGGTWEAPTWTEIDAISDWTVNAGWDGADSNDRSSRVKLSAKTLLGLEFSGMVKKKPGNAAYEAIMDALVSDDTLDILVLDGALDIEDSRGWRCDCQVHQANEDQGLESTIYEDVVLKPYPGDNPVYAVVVGATDLNFTEPGSE